MSLQTVFRYDAATGFYLGETEAMFSPLEPEQLLLPPDTTPISPPTASAGQAAKWSGTAWTLVETPEVAPAPDPAEPTEDELLAALRTQRDGLLGRSDWTQIPDAPLTSAEKSAWAAYRQALRDLPAHTSDPANPAWPTQPS